MTTSEAPVFIVDSTSESVLAVLTALLVWASGLFVVALIVSSAMTLVLSASIFHFPDVGPMALFVWASALFVIALMVSSTTTLVPSASTRQFPDDNLTALFVWVSALLVVALMLSTASPLFVLYFLPTLLVLMALLCRLHPLPLMFCS